MRVYLFWGLYHYKVEPGRHVSVTSGKGEGDIILSGIHMKKFSITGTAIHAQ